MSDFKKLGNELAFPFSPPVTADGGIPHPGYPDPGTGLSKREFVAAMALQGLLANPDVRQLKLADLAVEFADNLLRALSK